jgi:hypothetical protein
VDETRFEYDEITGDPTSETQCGNRVFTVEVRLESENQVNETETVGQLAGNLRTRLYRRGILAALRTAGVAVSSIGPTQDFDFVEDDRDVSVSVTEVVFSAAENDTDTTIEDGAEWIETVTITSKDPDGPDLLIGEDGEPLPDDLQVEIEGP